MVWLALYVTSLVVVICNANRLENFSTVDDFFKVCLDSQLHKSSPGPESKLFELCTPYKDWSCCTDEVAQQLHVNSTWSKFSRDHCRQLSSKCNQHFQRDLCFYECSPNVGPWLVQEKRGWRNERFYKVPLCASDCELWFSDCKDDFTCVQNWAKDFQWPQGQQRCPKNTETGEVSQCIQFKDMWRSAKEFCETVWDDSWQVVADTEPCMKINFQNTDVANNHAVARQKAEEIVKKLPNSTPVSSATNDYSSYLMSGGLFISLLLRSFASSN